MNLSELRRSVGGLFCVGFLDADANQALLDELADLAPAGVILFDRNMSDVERTRAFVESLLRAIPGNSPIVAVDQEGGRVARAPGLAKRIPSAMALGAINDGALVERVAERIGRELRAIGANVDFAPVADLAVEPRNTVIGTRAFGDDPERVGYFTASYIAGLRSGGIAAVSKHLPGHGGTVGDSHRELPRLEVDLETLEARELLPFRAAIKAGSQGIMTAHIVVPALDASAPASLSSAISRTLLRENLGFSGVCVTDCLEMAAIAETVGVARGAMLALAAGADLLLVSQHIYRAREARDAIVKAVEIGELPIERVIEASARVQHFRNGLPGLGQPLMDEEGEDLAAIVARRSLTAPRDMAVLRADMPVTILSFEKKTDRETPRQGDVERFSLNLALRRRRVRSEVMRVPLEPSDAMIAHLLELITLQSDRELILLIRRAHVYEAQRRAIETLLAHRPSALVVSLAEPFDLALLPQARRVLCTFGECEATVEALADALIGQLAPTGRLPVTLAPPGRIS